MVGYRKLFRKWLLSGNWEWDEGACVCFMCHVHLCAHLHTYTLNLLRRGSIFSPCFSRIHALHNKSIIPCYWTSTQGLGWIPIPSLFPDLTSHLLTQSMLALKGFSYCTTFSKRTQPLPRGRLTGSKAWSRIEGAGSPQAVGWGWGFLLEMTKWPCHEWGWHLSKEGGGRRLVDTSAAPFLTSPSW